MNKFPSVSVLMPVYNCGEYLEEAIKSILAQTFDDFEFIIVDGESTDETPKILNKYANNDSRIKIIREPKRGIVAALNTGLIHAKGDWIFRMDGDDIALPHRFAIQIGAIKKKVSLVLLGGWCQQVNSEGVPLKINKYPTEHDKLINRLEKGLSFFPHSSACFRRDKIVELGGYRDRFQHAEDADLWLRFINVGEVGCCRSVIIKLRRTCDYKLHLIELRGLAGYCARICYYRRKAGFSDPSQAKEADWQKFREWVAKRIEADGLFQRSQAWKTVRNIWYPNSSENKVKRAKRLVQKLICDTEARKAVYYRFHKGEDIALRLAEESRKLF